MKMEKNPCRPISIHRWDFTHLRKVLRRSLLEAGLRRENLQLWKIYEEYQGNTLKYAQLTYDILQQTSTPQTREQTKDRSIHQTGVASR